ncbi:hypothetical protein IG608_06305 [Pectobacterium sp. A113-S21-F16]|uniref:hypothetical protein n=1 Tax=Pectobacterium quasiaquaticum TaxID=2774015 RepID=UPI0018747CA2|nr:hypothetical protein [Pectobacterium quasiaquaticum]MBE5221089.1 hypothetical protein [Pectobacterium quasiaquaticum]
MIKEMSLKKITKKSDFEKNKGTTSYDNKIIGLEEFRILKQREEAINFIKEESRNLKW